MEGRYQIMKKLWQRMIMLSVILVMVMTVHAFADNSPLTSAYLLGYHHFNAEIYKKKEED